MVVGDNIQISIYILAIIFIIIGVIVFWNWQLRMQVKKRTSELRQIIDLVPHAIFVKDRQGRFILANKATADHYGMEPRQLVGKKHMELHDDLNEVQRYLIDDYEVMKSGQAKFIPEIPFKTPSGAQRYLQTTKIPFMYGKLKEPAVLGIAIDITGQKTQQAKQRRDEAKFSLSFKASPDSMVISRISDGIILDANESMLRQLGFKREEVVGRGTHELKSWVNPADRQKFMHDLKQYGKCFNLETVFRTKDGRDMPIIISATTVEIEGEVCIFSIVRDISDQKRAERVIHKLNAELEQRVRERTSELEDANKKLNEAIHHLQSDEEAGKELQLQLLPAENEVYDQYTFSRVLLPSMYLSGDFTDYFPVGEKHLVFYMADVSGHGTSSAFITVLLKSYITQFHKKFIYDKDQTIIHPHKVLEGLNQELLETKLDKYLTIFFAVIDKEKKMLHYCNGGQFPFPIFHENGKTIFISDTNMPVGLFEFADYKASEIQLGPEFCLTIISDGILEILPQKSLKEKEEFLLSAAGKPGLKLDGLIKQLKLHNYKKLPDDITFLRVKSRG